MFYIGFGRKLVVSTKNIHFKSNQVNLLIAISGHQDSALDGADDNEIIQ